MWIFRVYLRSLSEQKLKIVSSFLYIFSSLRVEKLKKKCWHYVLCYLLLVLNTEQKRTVYAVYTWIQTMFPKYPHTSRDRNPSTAVFLSIFTSLSPDPNRIKNCEASPLNIHFRRAQVLLSFTNCAERLLCV